MFVIEFKVKPYKVFEDSSLTGFMWAINFKKKVVKSDTNLKPCDHKYFNMTDFDIFLNRQYRKIIGEDKVWAFLDVLPEGVTVDNSKFLAVVKVALPESFF